MTSAADAVRAQHIAKLRAALEAEESDPARGTDRKDIARALRIVDNFRPDEDYEHVLRLRDSGDPRWHQAGTHVQVAAALYERQRAAANPTN